MDPRCASRSTPRPFPPSPWRTARSGPSGRRTRPPPLPGGARPGAGRARALVDRAGAPARPALLGALHPPAGGHRVQQAHQHYFWSPSRAAPGRVHPERRPAVRGALERRDGLGWGGRPLHAAGPPRGVGGRPSALGLQRPVRGPQRLGPERDDLLADAVGGAEEGQRPRTSATVSTKSSCWLSEASEPPHFTALKSALEVSE